MCLSLANIYTDNVQNVFSFTSYLLIITNKWVCSKFVLWARSSVAHMYNVGIPQKQYGGSNYGNVLAFTWQFYHQETNANV